MICSKCRVDKPADQFCKDKHAKSGRKGHCKPCANEMTRKWRKRNPQYIAEWREKHPGYDQDWYSNHRESALQAKRNWVENNPDRMDECRRRWREANPESMRFAAARRRARKLKAGGSHSRAQLKKLLISQKGCCWWCGEKLGATYHADHRVPLAKGGSNDIANIVLACAPCNLSKNAKMPDEFCGRLL